LLASIPRPHTAVNGTSRLIGALSAYSRAPILSNRLHRVNGVLEHIVHKNCNDTNAKNAVKTQMLALKVKKSNEVVCCKLSVTILTKIAVNCIALYAALEHTVHKNCNDTNAKNAVKNSHDILLLHQSQLLA